MVKKLTEEERKRLLVIYHKRERRNAHTENALMLIKRFGTPKQKVEARKKYVKVKRQGYLTYPQSNWFYRIGHKHYKKLRG